MTEGQRPATDNAHALIDAMLHLIASHARPPPLKELQAVRLVWFWLGVVTVWGSFAVGWWLGALGAFR